MDNIKKFVNEWKNRGYERGETDKFWLALLRDVLNVDNPETYINFEVPVKLEHKSYIDAFIIDTKIIIEQKSLNKNLEAAAKQSDGTILTPYEQAQRYGNALPVSMHPRWIITCNFREFLIYDMEKLTPPIKILLDELPQKFSMLEFIIDKNQHDIRLEEELSVAVAKRVDTLYETLKKNYRNADNPESLKSLNKLCVLIVFLMYAESVGIFGKTKLFTKFLETEGDLRRGLRDLFKNLNTPQNLRDPYEDKLNLFPYVNGGLFDEENLEIPKITPATRDILLREVIPFHWKDISPTIFGAVFESTIKSETVRRGGGMHYTSTRNIHKILNPLFLDDLRAEFNKIKTDKKALVKFQDKLASITVFDPACGSGNFLTESYIQLRKLENEVLKIIYGDGQIILGDILNPVKVSIRQFYGIEIDDFAVKVAQVALWISEIKMLQETAEIIHKKLEVFPLKSYANIHRTNALTTDWQNVIAAQNLNYIISNPPFLGTKEQTAAQKNEIIALCKDFKALDYVTGWYKKADDFIHDTKIRAAFVSTNSICQGEQVAPLWTNLGVHIDFAYQPFKWYSEAAGSAQVHVVVIGFSRAPNPAPKKIFTVEYERDDENKLIRYDEGENKGYPKEIISCVTAQNINGYLMDAPNIYVVKRKLPLCDSPEMTRGSGPTDDGNLIIEAADYDEFIKAEPLAQKYIKRYMGAEEFLKNKMRYCLWLVDCPPNELLKMKLVMKRVQAVKAFRLKSKAVATRKIADTPALFQTIRQPTTDYIVIPRVSSEKRNYIPMGFMTPDIIVSDAVQFLPNATIYHFGMLTSSVHMAWMRAVCGRLENRYRYSNTIVYNNFPWCSPSGKQKAAIEAAAQNILDVRAKYPEATLADLYNELTMPKDLRAAHKANDAAVMRAYGFSAKMTEPEIVGELFKMYVELTK